MVDSEQYFDVIELALPAQTICSNAERKRHLSEHEPKRQLL